MGGGALEFVMVLDHRPHGRLRLPDFFARAVERDGPPGFWLRAEDYYNDPTWAAAEFSPDGSLSLSRGWKSFACFYRLKWG